MAGSSHVDIVKDLGPMRIYGKGSVYRLNLDELDFSAIPVMNEDSIYFEDFTYDEPRDLQLRMYKPKSTTDATSNVHKLPIIVYVHGGGFCNGSRVWPNCHDSCLRLTSGTGTVVVAPDFGLSPENRIPVIYDNVIHAVRWIGGWGGHEWLSEEGGGVEVDLESVCGWGLFQQDPRAPPGGLARVRLVELGSGQGPGLRSDFALLQRGRVNRIGEGFDRAVIDFGDTRLISTSAYTARARKCWKLALLDGATRDNPWANPFGSLSPDLEAVVLGRVLVIAGGSEMSKDGIDEYVKRLTEMGKAVECKVFEGRHHKFTTSS